MSGTNVNRICAARASRLTSTGAPTVASATGAWMLCDVVSAGTTPTYDSPTTATQRDGCGTVRFSRRTDDQLTGYDVALTVCANDPRQMEMFLGGDVSILGTTPIMGWALRGGACQTSLRYGIALELWYENWMCQAPFVDFPYIRGVFPKVRLRWDGGTHDEGLFLWSFSGYAEPNPLFGDGPFNDLDPLELITDAYYAEVFDTALPTCPSPAAYTATPAAGP